LEEFLRKLYDYIFYLYLLTGDTFKPYEN
jgi:hypothetical protein